MDEPIRPKSSTSSKSVPKHDTKKRDVKSSQKPKDSKTVKDVRDKPPKDNRPKDEQREPRERKEDKREGKREEPREKREDKREDKREESQNKEAHPKTKEPSIKIVNELKSYLEYRDDGLVVVDFNTSWCGPCREFGPTFEEIANNYPGVTFLSVDAESFEHEDTTSVKSVPTFKVFLNGVLRREFSGVKEAREKLERYIERYQIQILINGRTQRAFPQNVKDKVSKYMDMFQPE